jgi:hypothetical protein
VADDAGLILVQAGLIASEQLELARQDQAARGGTLGEQLVRNGFLDDEELTRFYTARLKVPRVERRQLDAIDRAVIDRIPADMAVEHRLVPIAVDPEQNLVVAMSDPSNTRAIDEITFFAGTSVVRTVATQREIAWCLETYYGVRTPLRSVTAPDPTDGGRGAAPQLANATPPTGTARPLRISDILPAMAAEEVASPARQQQPAPDRAAARAPGGGGATLVEPLRAGSAATPATPPRGAQAFGRDHREPEPAATQPPSGRARG